MMSCYIILSSILNLLDGELQDYGMGASERIFFVSFSQTRGKSIIFLQIPYYESKWKLAFHLHEKKNKTL